MPVSLTHTLNQIDDALNTSIYARAAVKKDDSGLVVDRGAPAWLGHLTLPESDFRYVAKVQDDFLLPGVVDAKDIDNSEEVRRSSWSTSRVHCRAYLASFECVFRPGGILLIGTFSCTEQELESFQDLRPDGIGFLAGLLTDTTET